MDKKQKQKLKKFINELKQIRGRHTELVSVYIPAGYELNKIIQHLQQEQHTASNIKDARTRKNVIDSLERAIVHLRLYKKTPEHGLAVFAGNASDKENKIDIKVWSIEPPEPLNTRMYRCDQTFVLDILENMMEIKEVYGLVVVDRREGDIGLLKGTAITKIVGFKSDVPGKTTKGGQCCHSNSFVQISDGSIMRIKDLHNPLVLKSLNATDYSMRDSPILNKWDTTKKGFKIITRFPRLEIIASKDHLFYVYDKGLNERSVSELKVGDKLIMPDKINVEGEIQFFDSLKYYNSYSINSSGRKFLKEERKKCNLYQSQLAKKMGLTQTGISVIELGKRNVSYHILRKLCKKLHIDFFWFIKNYTKPAQKYKLPNKIDETFAQILGYLIGDGDIEKTRMTFSERDHETAVNYQKLISQYFDCGSNLRFREKKNYWEVRIQGQPISKFIKSEFPEIKINKKSLIPSKILRSPNHIVSCFLKGLYDAEGFCSGGKVTIAMNDELLIRQLQMTLLRFGIISSFLEYDNRKNPYTDNHKFIVDITEKKSIKLFNQFIGFSYYKKQKKVEELLLKMTGRSSVRQIIFSGSEVREIMKERGLNTSTRFLKGLNNYFMDKGNISKDSFRNIILKAYRNSNNNLFSLVDVPILPVQISKIEPLKEKISMSDISVKNQNFIANCVIVHNSQSRYAGIREAAAKDFFKKVGNAVNKEFLEMKNLKGILIGGPGPTKHTFIDGPYLNNEIKKKIISIQDLSYTGEFGLNELVDKSQDVLAKESIIEEKKILNRLFEMLAKEPEKVAYGKKETMKAIEIGAVELLLLSEDLDDDLIEDLSSKAEKIGSSVEIISIETKEGIQLKELGGIAAILRFQIS